ncbi:MAG: aspartate carbamoyltransferase catalytic subunit [Myxococcota bacterium]|nr:aspartate carbamoyltransferase catalytic subunit [Myxococcota bacterium]
MIQGQHLLGMEGLSADTIYSILDTSKSFKQVSKRTIKKVPSLRGRTILNVFYEASTRTRVSFELAAKRLSADGVNIAASGSSTAKGESLLDMAQTLDAMQADAVVIRHGQSGAPHYLADRINARVINAGDGQHEHPTQALLDIFTIREHFANLEGLEVAIVGDIRHSRVARSNLIAMRTLGMNVRVAGPTTLVPAEFEKAYDCTRVASVEEAMEGAQVVMALRLQKERMVSGLLPSLGEYADFYGINKTMMGLMADDGILMHPGPVNRGVELSPDVVNSKRSVILQQVENGVAIRCAVLFLLLGGETP